MVTFSSEAFRPEALKGIEILDQLCINHAVGVMPATLLASLQAEYEVSVRDLKASAIGLDADESREIEFGALERAAYRMGKHDGARVLADRQGLSSEMSEGDFLAAHDVTETIQIDALAGYERVFDHYKRGMIAAASILYVTRNHPMERRRLSAEARAVRSMRDPAQAEELVEVNRWVADEARRQGIDAYAIAAASAAVAEETADRVAEDVLKDHVEQLGRGMPTLTASECLARARLVFRTSSAQDDEVAQKAHLRAAWLAVPMSEIEARVQEGRDSAARSAEEEKVARSAAVTR